MKYKEINQEKGVAGLNVLLSLIAMLFMIGIIIMVFVISGARLRTAVKTTETLTVEDTSLTVNDGGTTLTTCNANIDGEVTSITSAYNVSGSVAIYSGNYTFSGCTITAVGTEFNNTVWNVSYVMTTGGEAGNSINDTYSSFGDVTDWFPTFIVLGAMVVLILLVVIIIKSIKASGITQGA